MIFILLILLILICVNIRMTGAEEQCLGRDNTNAIKGIFIIIVFCSHLLPYLTSGGAFLSPVFDIPAKNFINRTGQLMVVMFLFYSGYGVMESIQKKGNSYVKSIPVRRILSTLVNYDIAIVLFLCLNLLLGIHFKFRKYLLSLIAWDSVGQSNWYIFAILFCYISTFISFSIIRQKNKALIAIVILLVSYCIILCHFKNSWWYNTILTYPAGMTVSLFKQRIFSFLEKHYLLSVFGLFLLFIICFHFRGNILVYPVTSIVFGFLVFAISPRFK